MVSALQKSLKNTNNRSTNTTSRHPTPKKKITKINRGCDCVPQHNCASEFSALPNAVGRLPLTMDRTLYYLYHTSTYSLLLMTVSIPPVDYEASHHRDGCAIHPKPQPVPSKRRLLPVLACGIRARHLIYDQKKKPCSASSHILNPG